ncbi:hypothetical protein ACW5EG_09670 [Luteimonas sp. A611]
MHDERSDFSQVEFRNPVVRHFPRREEDSGTPFWRIVGAVFTALCLFGLLQTLIAVVLYRHAVEDLDRRIEALMPKQGESVFAPPPAPTPAHRPAAPRLPVHPGPIEARRAGFPQACIGGFTSNRVEGGWSQTRQRCTAAGE